MLLLREETELEAGKGREGRAAELRWQCVVQLPDQERLSARRLVADAVVAKL